MNRHLPLVLISMLALGNPGHSATPEPSTPTANSSTSPAGKWAGRLESKRGRAALSVELIQSSGQWKATGTVKFEGDPTVGEPFVARKIEWKDKTLTFTTDIRGTEVRFTGKLNSQKFAGAFVIRDEGQKPEVGRWTLIPEIESKP